MGFLSSAEAAVASALAAGMAPPPPPDITRWCEENIVFDERSPMPGPFRINRFPFLREIHEVLSPEHPAREVTFIKSAQIGGTVSVINPTLGAWHEYRPVDSLVVHPTMSSATEWVDNKWLPMRRQAPSLLATFGTGRGGDNKDAKFNQETANRNGSLKVASAGSPDDLAGTSRPLVLLDDLAKFEMTSKGDPEAMAVSRASAYEDAKILRNSTPQVAGTCRITRAWLRSDRRLYNVPCPHCGNAAPLTWDNFRKNLDPERLAAAHFTCDACGCVIGHEHKVAMLAGGFWRSTHASGDHPGFHIWRAYAPQRDWASIAVEYAQVMGWTRLKVSESGEGLIRQTVEAETEQTFHNDVLGLAYEQASKGPDWEKLRDRVEEAGKPEALLSAEDVLPQAIVPARGVLLVAGVDCQDDRLEVQVVAYGPNAQRWVVDYRVIPHFIGDQEGWDALDALLKASWRTAGGRRQGLDMLAIDGGTYNDAVWRFAKRHPWTKVIIVKGASTQTGPLLMPMKFERRKDGSARRRQKRAFMVNVSQMKADFYAWLAKEDPLDRGFVHIARGLGDEYFRQLTAEVRVLKRARSGVVTSAWELAEPSRRNEGLDTMLYSEAAARRLGWASMTEAQWAKLEDERGGQVAESQGDLFEQALNPASDHAAPIRQPSTPAKGAPGEDRKVKADRREPGDDWLGNKGSDWL
ncbi:phage terminase large subunit family protein [Pseudoroseicyclus sp. CXY001]|uniref:phage terminase large subunit family protein n=1 Tax=Pseudoroseicyclus sp. CXY001 TaxID=3242492 RepID=UPI0035716ACF